MAGPQVLVSIDGLRQNFHHPLPLPSYGLHSIRKCRPHRRIYLRLDIYRRCLLLYHIHVLSRPVLLEQEHTRRVMHIQRQIYGGEHKHSRRGSCYRFSHLDYTNAYIVATANAYAAKDCHYFCPWRGHNVRFTPSLLETNN